MKKHIFYYRAKLKNIHKNFIYSKNFKILKKNIFLKSSIRQKVMFNIFIKNSKINCNNIRKYCVFTGRLRSLVSRSKFNRLNFRELVSKGQVPGVFKK